MMTMKTINTIANAINYEMDFNTALDIVKQYTDDISVIYPDDVNFGSIIVGNPYGNSLTIDFNDDDLVECIDVDDGEWD